MALAREFSTQVIQKLEAIRFTISEQKAEFSQLARRVDTLHLSIDQVSRQVAHLAETESEILRRNKQ